MQETPAVDRGRSLGVRVLHAPALGLLATLVSGAALVLRFEGADARSRLDFTIYYHALRALNAGGDVYAYSQPGIGLGFTYPPFAALVLEPLTRLGQSAAAVGWLVTSTVLSAVFCRLLLRLVPASALPVGPWLLVAALLWSVPVYLTLRLGQVDALIWLLVIVDVLLVLSGRRGGWLSGVAAAVKLTPLALVLLFAGVRRADAVGRLAIAFTACTGVAALWRPPLSRTYWTEVLWQTRRVGRSDTAFNNSLWRLTSTAPLAPPAALVVGALLALAVAAAAFVGSRWAADSGRLVLAAGVGTLAPCLLSPVTWSHHLYPMLLLPFAVLAEPTLQARPVWRAVAGLSSLLGVFELGDVGQNGLLCQLRAAALVAAVLGVGALGVLRLTRATTSEPRRP